ncbi:DUF4160 domain-containing protein [Thermopetrobacter sp. TC1]|uniref:DUF4160 domain-containing protein n=1 Tax=Thermopetrobacter sp. TC1 TaxID=1495045 RepID=UPI001E329B60|nr:DUF4160 domain-containing protein [Thermopetrobacter sp. TC1]
MHVQRERALAKFWLEPVALASSKHFSAHELSTLLRYVMKHRQRMLETWHDYFGG